MTDFCETLRERRKSVGLSQRKLAELAGLDIKTVRDAELGRTRKPQKATLELINAVFEEERKKKFGILTGSETK